MKITTDLYLGDSKKELKKIKDNTVDLIVTSPPYADQRKVLMVVLPMINMFEWFLPISEQILRVLKPTGTFILNIKEKVVDGETKYICYGTYNCHEEARMVVDRGVYMAQEKLLSRQMA